MRSQLQGVSAGVGMREPNAVLQCAAGSTQTPGGRPSGCAGAVAARCAEGGQETLVYPEKEAAENR